MCVYTHQSTQRLPLPLGSRLYSWTHISLNQPYPTTEVRWSVKLHLPTSHPLSLLLSLPSYLPPLPLLTPFLPPSPPSYGKSMTLGGKEARMKQEMEKKNSEQGKEEGKEPPPPSLHATAVRRSGYEGNHTLSALHHTVGF